MMLILYMLAQTMDPPATGNILTIGAGAIAAAGTAVAAVVAAYRKGRREKVKLEEPLPEFPVKRVFSPPTFHQHLALEKRVDRLEHSFGEMRREQANQFKELLEAGEVRANRLADKLDNVAREFHARVDDLLKHAPPPPITPNPRKR